jgi:hypothetical protein
VCPRDDDDPVVVVARRLMRGDAIGVDDTLDDASDDIEPAPPVVASTLCQNPLPAAIAAVTPLLVLLFVVLDVSPIDNRRRTALGREGVGGADGGAGIIGVVLPLPIGDDDDEVIEGLMINAGTGVTLTAPADVATNGAILRNDDVLPRLVGGGNDRTTVAAAATTADT